jgi:hypothetical protein
MLREGWRKRCLEGKDLSAGTLRIFWGKKVGRWIWLAEYGSRGSYPSFGVDAGSSSAETHKARNSPQIKGNLVAGGQKS